MVTLNPRLFMGVASGRLVGLLVGVRLDEDRMLEGKAFDPGDLRIV